jgi:hypothetical protein
MSEASRGVPAATELQQVAMATTVVVTMAVTAPSILPAPAPAGGNQVAVVEVPDDDVLPPGWGQWESLPALDPKPPVGVLVMREDGCVMSGRPAHGVEASSSRAALLASGGTAAHSELEEERVDTPSTHFNEAQDEQALWEEFRGHDASLNWALNEALRIHSVPVWCVFQIRDCSLSLAVLPLFVPSASALPLICASWSLSAGGRNWRIGPGRGTVPSTR